MGFPCRVDERGNRVGVVELSGSQEVPAAVGRRNSGVECAGVPSRDLLLMDEPFGALDEIVRDRLNEEVLKLWARTGKTIGFVTHSIPEAVYLSTKIVVMSPRPGRITDVIDSPLPRERPLDIRDSREFIEIAHRVREGLRAVTGHRLRSEHVFHASSFRPTRSLRAEASIHDQTAAAPQNCLRRLVRQFCPSS